MSTRKVYTYEVVTSNGAGIHSTHPTFREARAAAERLASQSFAWGYIEIQRVEHCNGRPGGWPRRYWMRQRKRWVCWCPRRDVLARQPDWLWDRSERKA